MTPGAAMRQNVTELSYEKACGLNLYYRLMNRFRSGGLPTETVTPGAGITLPESLTAIGEWA